MSEQEEQQEQEEEMRESTSFDEVSDDESKEEEDDEETEALDVKVEKCIQDTNGRYLILDLLIDELHLILVNIYAPNDANQQVTFFKELENHLEDFAQENIIIAGDFNCALSENDRKGGNPVWKKSIVIKEVQHLANLYNLTDIWRDRNPNDNHFTWRKKSLKTQCRLDFF